SATGDERGGQAAALDVDHAVVDRGPVEPDDHVEALDVRSGATEGYGEVTETARSIGQGHPKQIRHDSIVPHLSALTRLGRNRSRHGKGLTRDLDLTRGRRASGRARPPGTVRRRAGVLR